MSTCNGCGQPIRWVITEANRKSMPLDPQPAEDGIVTMTGRTARSRSGDEVPVVAVHPVGRQLGLLDPSANEPRYRPHFATCPDADRYRKDRQ